MKSRGPPRRCDFSARERSIAKAGIAVRQSFDADATYADVVIHGNGMPGLQWRSRQGEDANTFDPPFDGPGMFKIKLVRNGVKVFMYTAKAPELKEIAHTEVSLGNPLLTGIGVCSHQADDSTTVIFSNVVVETLAKPRLPRNEDQLWRELTFRKRGSARPVRLTRTSGSLRPSQFLAQTGAAKNIIVPDS